MKAVVADVQRIRCMCGEIKCKYCGHSMSAHCSHSEKLPYCPNCGHPLLAEALNVSEKKT